MDYGPPPEPDHTLLCGGRGPGYQGTRGGLSEGYKVLGKELGKKFQGVAWYLIYQSRCGLVGLEWCIWSNKEGTPQGTMGGGGGGGGGGGQ